MDSSDLDIEPLGDGVSIHLPHRKLGAEKKLGWLAILFGVIVSIFMLIWIATPVSWGIGLLNQGERFGFLFIAFGSLGLIGLFHAVKAVVFGIAVLNDQTRCTVTIANSKIVNEERFGWFRFRIKQPADEVEELCVAPISSLGSSDDEESGRNLVSFIENYFGGEAHRLFAITFKKEGGKFLAAFYPQKLLDRVAAAIASELNRELSNSVLVVRKDGYDEPSDSLQQVTVSKFDPSIRELEPVLPENSVLETVQEGDSTVYKVRKRTVWAGSGGLFLFSIVWNVIVALITISIFTAKGDGPVWVMVAFMSVFGAVGIGTFVGAIYVARQSALIGVKHGLLFIERKTIFGTKWIEFEAANIESIEMAHSNMEVNEVPVMNLRITPKEGKPVSMFAQLGNEELKWLAFQLQNELGVESAEKQLATGKFDLNEQVVVPKETDIEVEERHGQLFINVPPWPFEGSKEFRTVSLVFMCLPLPLVIAAIFFFGLELFVLVFAFAATAVGVVMFLLHRAATTRSFSVRVDHDSVKVDVSGFMSQRQFSLQLHEFLEVNVFNSETKMSSKPLFCVRVKGTQDRSISFMTGRKMDELAWVAQLIHQKVKLNQENL